MSPDECLFCRLAREGDHVHAAPGFVAIRDIAPKAETHLLVLPTRHVDSFRDVAAFSDAEAAAAVALNMENFEFAPGSLSVAASDKLLLINSDIVAHDLSLEEGDVYVRLGPGGESLVELGDLPTGTYDYFCSLHSFEENGVKEGMVGTITIES